MRRVDGQAVVVTAGTDKGIVGLRLLADVTHTHRLFPPPTPTGSYRHLIDYEVLQVQAGTLLVRAPIKRRRVVIEGAQELAPSLSRIQGEERGGSFRGRNIRR